MATSGFLTTGQPDNYGLGGKAGTTDYRTTGTGTSAGSSTTGGTSNTNSTTSGTTSQTTNTHNLDPASQAALDTLIRQIISGGTDEQKKQAAERSGEINSVQGIRSGYSKQSAFNDAQGLVAQTMRRALESMLPSINRAAEDAGSSGGALRALLMQDAADKASQSASAEGLKAAESYGGISANLSQVLEELTKGTPVTDSLINALNVAKGANVTSTTTGTSTQNTQGTTTSAQQTNNAGSTTQDEFKDFAPFVTNNPVGTQQIAYGNPVDAPKIPIGSTLDTLLQLAGGNNAWSDYKIG